MRITMINSVGEHEAGTEVDVDDAVGDRFILLGYATGTLTREYTDAEKAEFQAQTQVVSV